MLDDEETLFSGDAGSRRKVQEDFDFACSGSKDSSWDLENGTPNPEPRAGARHFRPGQARGIPARALAACHMSRIVLCCSQQAGRCHGLHSDDLTFSSNTNVVYSLHTPPCSSKKQQHCKAGNHNRMPLRSLLPFTARPSVLGLLAAVSLVSLSAHTLQGSWDPEEDASPVQEAACGAVLTVAKARFRNGRATTSKFAPFFTRASGLDVAGSDGNLGRKGLVS